MFDTTSIEDVIETVLKVNSDATIVIKSTVPVGYTDFLIKKYNYDCIMFSPEFLREGKALQDNLYPSRIVVGATNCASLRAKAQEFAQLLKHGSAEQKAPILITSTTEAECIKLFANTYLALRVGFFNELDMYAENRGLDACAIIEGVCMDPRIGNHYNNPSFGYGGYCLPKDTKQLLASYGEIPNEIIRASVQSNETRKNFIVDQILKKASQTSNNSKCVIGFYRLAMKKGSDNLRESSSQDVMRRIRSNEHEVVVYEPLLTPDGGHNFKVINNIDEFKQISDVIVVNRNDDALNDVMHKIYTRDLFCRD